MLHGACPLATARPISPGKQERPSPAFMQRTSAKSRVTTSVHRQLTPPAFSSTARRRHGGPRLYSITLTGETVSIYQMRLRAGTSRRRRRDPSVSSYRDVFGCDCPAPSHRPEALWKDTVVAYFFSVIAFELYEAENRSYCAYSSRFVSGWQAVHQSAGDGGRQNRLCRSAGFVRGPARAGVGYPGISRTGGAKWRILGTSRREVVVFRYLALRRPPGATAVRECPSTQHSQA